MQFEAVMVAIMWMTNKQHRGDTSFFSPAEQAVQIGALLFASTAKVKRTICFHAKVLVNTHG